MSRVQVEPANERRNALSTFGYRASERDAQNPLAVLKSAKALFGLEKVPLGNVMAKGFAAAPGQFAVVRRDTNTVIGCVGEEYKCFDNETIFGTLGRDLCKFGGRINSFSELESGGRAFMQFSFPDDVIVKVSRNVGDIVGKRAIISTSHNGKYSARLSLFLERLACSNGMSVPVGVSEFALQHSVGGELRLKEIQDLLPDIHAYFNHFNRIAEIFAATTISPQDELCLKIISRIADPNGKAKERKDGEPNQASNRIQNIMNLFDGGQPGGDRPPLRETAWGLFNAVSDYMNHGKRTRGEDQEEQRFKQLLPGGLAQKDIVRAFEEIVRGLDLREQIKAAITN